MINNEYKGFINAIGKVDKINIILKFKSGKYFKKELFFIQKKIIYYKYLNYY